MSAYRDQLIEHEEWVEQVIRCTLSPSGSEERRRSRTEHRLLEALENLRAQGFEVDIFLRGVWRLGKCPRFYNLRDVQVPKWKKDGNQIRFECADLPGTVYLPALKRTPPPEIVLRGTRRVMA
jgi:hypothetical protein